MDLFGLGAMWPVIKKKMGVVEKSVTPDSLPVDLETARAWASSAGAESQIMVGKLGGQKVLMFVVFIKGEA